MHAMRRVSIRLQIAAEIRLRLLGHGVMRRHVFEFARSQARHIDLRRIVHRAPGSGRTIRRMRIGKARPQVERLAGLRMAVEKHIRPLRHPGAVVQLLGKLPLQRLRDRMLEISREIFSPILAALLLEPDRVVLPRPGLIRMIAIHLHMLESVERRIPFSPKIKVRQQRRGLQRRILRRLEQMLEMRFPNERGVVARFSQQLADCRLVLRQLRAQ